MGLYLTLKDNQKILIGTQKAEELKSFLKKKSTKSIRISGFFF
jgi:hypothetical protein